MKTHTIHTPSGPIHVAKHSTGAVAVADKDDMTRSRFTQELLRLSFPKPFFLGDDGHAWRAESVKGA